MRTKYLSFDTLAENLSDHEYSYVYELLHNLILERGDDTSVKQIQKLGLMNILEQNRLEASEKVFDKLTDLDKARDK